MSENIVLPCEIHPRNISSPTLHLPLPQ